MGTQLAGSKNHNRSSKQVVGGSAQQAEIQGVVCACFEKPTCPEPLTTILKLYHRSPNGEVTGDGILASHFQELHSAFAAPGVVV